MNVYKTAEIAKCNGIHPNTVRLYEELLLISKPERKSNGYRIFTDIHMEQVKLVRTALKVEILQNGLRKMAINIIKTSASGDLEHAIKLTRDYIKQIRIEIKNAEEAITITEQLLLSNNETDDRVFLTRQQTANRLQISMDALRNWEMNGLLKVRRKKNGYRVYTDEDIRRLSIIRSLRCANYSLSSILRMLSTLSENPQVDIRKVIDTPKEEDDIISVCDKLLSSLKYAEKNAYDMLDSLKKMKKLYKKNPTL